MKLKISKVGFLHYLQYYINKQHSLMKIAIAEKDKWSKWKYLMEADWGFIKKSNNRTILSNEIVVDIDYSIRSLKSKETEQLVKLATMVLDKLGLKYDVYFSGSRGIHIHSFILHPHFFNSTQEERDQFRMKILEKIPFADKQKKEGSMIAIEFSYHWKTGQKKVWIPKYSTLKLPLMYYQDFKEILGVNANG